MLKRITVFPMMAMLLISVSPLGAFAQTNQSNSTDTDISQPSISSPTTNTGVSSPPPPCIPPDQAPKTPPPLSKEEYVKRALRNICLDPDSFFRDRGSYDVTKWRWINRAITARYAELYVSHPDVFKWAGMAAYASNLVGWGMGRLAYAASGFSYGMFNSLRDGNIELYLDISWQHEAYMSEGICAIERIYHEGKLANRLEDAKALLEAWRKIDNGMRTGNSELVWQGNADLLAYEQKVFLQRIVYAPNRDLWRSITDSSLLPIFSPVPEDSVTFVKYMEQNYPGTKPDLGDSTQRWNWISNSMLPKYKALETGTYKVELHTTRYINEMNCKQPVLHRSPIPKPAGCPCEVWNITPETQSTPATEPTSRTTEPTTTPTTPSQPAPTPTEPTTPAPVPAPTPPPEPPDPTCPEGQVLEDGECVDRTDISCPEGQILVDGECVDPPEEPPEDGGSGGNEGSGGDEPNEPSDNGGGEDNGDGGAGGEEDNGEVIIED